MIYSSTLVLLVLALLQRPAHCQQFTIQFSPTNYNPILAEEEPAGTEVVVVGANYRDSFGIVQTDGTFSIPLDGDAQYFTIETSPAGIGLSRGTVRTAAVLDRDTPGAQTSFVFLATYAVPDNSVSESVTVRVTLDDINDNAPNFTQRVFEAPVVEETPGGTPFFNVTAIDPDLLLITQTIDEDAEDFGALEYTVDNGRIIYSIVSGNELGHFSINEDNGTLSLSPGTQLDIDVVELYNLTVMTVDGGGLTDTATVFVHVLDSNDNKPQILSPLAVELTLVEDTAVGYLLLEMINATDEDRGLNAAIQYLIVDGDVTNSFSIEEGTGKIVISSPLDREAGAVVNLTVAARDQGIPPLQDTIYIVIHLLDVNDFIPTFPQSSYEATVNENSVPGTSVIQIVAVDYDEGLNGTVTYTILEGGEGKFTIYPQTGEIFSNGSLDHELVPSYHLLIEAIDNPANSSYQLSSLVNVTVLIGDVNDNAPVFDQDSYEIEILDTVRRNNEIIQVLATDLDVGTNGEISYEIVNADPSDVFAIRADTGIVYVNKLFMFEDQPMYTYAIKALDNGVFRLTADVELTIVVHNLNENPPVFEQLEYNATINETVPVGTVVLNVSAHDPDVGEIGEVRYRIVSEFDAAGSFEVNETTGEVYVNSTLDYDFSNYTFFQIEAYDGGFPEPYTDIANITIFFIGENDEAPSILFTDGFHPTVPENEPPPIDVVILSQFTSDPDFGLGGEFIFAITQIYDQFAQNGSFVINETTGLITSLRIFDRELQPEGIVVAIETMDFGTPQQSKVTNVTILIGDKNDQRPYFESNVSATVYEFMPPGAEVLSEYRARDDDIGENARLEYSIFDGDDLGQFSINVDTGGIYTMQVLNKTEQKYYNLTILAMDQGVPQMNTFGQISIEVLDANDQTPIFSEAVYNASFPESSPSGTTILQANATDSDIGTNAEFRYLFAPNSSHIDRFTVNGTTGEVYTTDIFDRENETFFELTILAVDIGFVALTGESTILVYLQDSNDNTPAFNETTYETHIVENEFPDTFVIAVLAYDVDAEYPNNAINYSLSGNRSDEFRIDPLTGEVFVSGEVDWEAGANFTIVATATDLGEPPLSAAADIMIFIEDVNDRAPNFVPESLNLSIFEDSVIGTEVGSVLAVDPDSAGNNSRVSYSIQMDFSSGRFALDSENGLVTFVKGTLNREDRPTFDLLIRATDHGSPQLHTDATLIINISDSNDFDPVFDQETFTGSVYENAGLGTSILTVHATDMDTGSNADLRYTILDPAYLVYFSIDETTGTISTNSTDFDFENIVYYVFDIFVTDLGIPPRNDTARVRIQIIDANDLTPEFEQLEYTAVLRENLAQGTTILRVNTTDGDTDLENIMVEYTLKDGVGSEYFGLHPETGVLYTSRYINREETPYFTMTIVANNSAAAIPLSSEAQVFVNVTDLNDMHPTFELVTEVLVTENTTTGSVIYTLVAVDGDEGPNGSVTYSIHLGNDDGVFELDSESGDVTLRQGLDFETRSLYMFAVMAQDNGNNSLFNYTNVLIHVLDSNDQQPFFTNTEIEVTINAAVSVGAVVAAVVALDHDEGSNAKLTYYITEDTSPGLFELVSEDEGIIRTTASLSSYPGQDFNLLIQASDPNFNATTNVTIYIQAASSTLPYFLAQSFMAAVAEDAIMGQNIFGFSGSVVNADNGFQIVSGDPEGIFTIDTMGMVRLESASLDFETQALHQLSISIANSAGNKSYTILDIVVTDVNEHGPDLVTDSIFIGLPETTPTGEPFFTILASDTDGSSPANEIAYAITSSDSLITTTFRVDSQSGELSLRRDLDYEIGDRYFTFNVSATNAMVAPHFSVEATINVTILNGNNYMPYFTSSSYSISLSENASVGINIVNVSAFDDDMGSQGEITYGMLGDHRYLDFRIDTFTGQVFINYPLDYERHNLYTLEVVASDGGNPNQFAIAAIRVSIQDLNDNYPIWEQNLYSVNLVENITLDTAVIQVSATDADQVDQVEIGEEVIFHNRNGYVTYSISNGDPDNQFDIDPDTGIVTIVASLDRETYPEYNLTLNATDGGDLFTNAYLHIVVHDVNDEIPEFTEAPYTVEIPENAQVGTFLLQVIACDYDLNPAVVYDIAGGNVNETFILNSTTGEIWLNRSLDREIVSSYVLVVEAMDMGPMPLTGTTEVHVTILDINEFPPVFSQGAYVGEILENEPPHTPILFVNASDMDFGENATVLFSIVSSNDTGPFDIISATGEIFVAGGIDYEQAREYSLVVMAIDSGPISERLSSEVNVTIRVLDQNDNAPEFSNMSYTVLVREDAIEGSDFLTLQVSDADSGTNAQIVFSFDYGGNQEAEMNIVIDAQSGVISLTNVADLDHERTLFYNLVINATDLGIPPRLSTAPLKVDISDANDNYPLFTAAFFEGSIFENLPPGTIVTNISSTDADEGLNSEIIYEISSLIERENDCLLSCDGAEFCQDVFSDGSQPPIVYLPFTIGNTTGDILSADYFDRENISDYVLVILARDSSVNDTQLSNTTCVHVSILDRNDEHPQFIQSTYNANISEYAQSGELVTQVLAIDGDLSSNAEISYQLLSEASSFTIHPETGEIFTLGGYDRETRDTFILTVQVTDKGEPPLNSTAVVMVTILDENDFAPEFSEQLYYATVTENLPTLSPVLQLNATDMDIDENADIAYSVQTSTPANHFEIDTITGQIYTSRVLDREDIELYLLTILVIDHGNPPLNTTTQVNINILDTNDLPPVFIGVPYIFQIEENYQPIESILTIQAEDGDIGTNAKLTFTLDDVSPPGNDAFELNVTTGELFLSRTLDAEYSLSYNLTVIVSNGLALPEQYTETVVTVEIIDRNDNVPHFDQLDYVVAILEESQNGSVVVQVSATDLDATEANSQLWFEITGGNDSSLFGIDSITGVISVSGPLDRETQSQHVLQVSVTDRGSPAALNDTTTVTIILEDSNDNAPVFEQTVYMFSVQENQPLLTLIGQIRASDIDLQVVTYYIPDNSTDSLLFTVNTTTGELFSTAVFDREMQEFYSFVAIATDGGIDIERTAQVTVMVTVLDQNDVAPAFLQDVYNVSWNENTTVGTALLAVMSLDPDLGANGALEYSLMLSNDSTFFSINSTTGEVFLDREFDREMQNIFQFTVVAMDFGTPSRLNGTATVLVAILDINDNTPVLNASEYRAIVNEDTEVGSVITFIGGSDRDIDQNAEIHFSLSGDFDGTFAIGSQSGVLSLARSLDYEMFQNYSFSVIAQDGGEEPLSFNAAVVIEVVDLNDNPPVFDNEVYQVSIPENSVLDTVIFHIPATDSDSTSNGELRYSITSGNLGAKFAISETAGVISLADYVDRELVEFYSLSLHVTDLGSPPLTANAELEITILDVNDHSPEFDSKTYSILVPENAGIGSIVFTVEAQDSDIDQNANLTYAITNGNTGSHFEIGSISGEISVAMELDFETISSYTLTISVSDNGSPVAFSDIMNLRILLTDQNEHSPSFAQSSYLVNISENTVVGTPIGYFVAIDADTHSHTLISYSLRDMADNAPFSVDQLTGRVYVSSEPDPSSFNLVLEASDGQYLTQIEIFITVLPLSSPNPLFEPPAFYFEVSETASLNTLVGQVNTSSSSDSISLTTSDGIGEIFEVMSDGRINLIGQLDRETTPAYVFNVQSSTEPVFAIVTVQVTDYNDFPPVFESPFYSVSLSELSPVGTTILMLAALDADPPGENSQFEIVISEGDEGGIFTLNPQTGALTIATMLDFEAQSYFVLTANVTNHLASPELYSTAEVLIEVIDENDNDPEFSQMFYQVQIPESTPFGSQILILEATDIDSGTNSELVYSITHLDVPSSFTINQTTGAISTNMTFDLRGITSSYEISVRVADRGNPLPRSDVTTVFVEVIPSNLYTPVFSQPEGYSLEVPETLPVGGLIVQVSATDPDSTLPLPVLYSILSEDPDGKFEIDPSNGFLSTTMSLDFLEQSFYILTVEAQDLGTPPKSSSLEVNISVVDINDHDPLFEQSIYEVSILENITAGSLFLQVSASDPDAVRIIYVLTVNAFENGVPLFDINTTTAEIHTVSPIDREFADRLELLVSAIDSGYPVQRSTSVPVIVLVQDLNDSPPQFNQSEYNISVLRFLPPGQTVAMVTTSDPDLIGQALQYSIIEDSSGGLFLVDSASGVIVSAAQIPEATTDVYELTLSVFDGVFTTVVPVHAEGTSLGGFCEDGGFCTRVRPVACVYDIFPYIECNPFCTGEYELSPERQLCLSFYCLDSQLVPCTSMKTCILPNEACAGVCPEGMSVCPTTNICHVTSLTMSCDGSNETCLIGQTLVQREDKTRNCVTSTALPANGQVCTGEGLVYCEALDQCWNISVPFLCQACPGSLFECPDTGECVPDLAQCCGFDGYYCDILNQCVNTDERCELPNIAPSTESDLIYLESITSFDPEAMSSGDGHVTGLLLSNSSPAVDSQGEEVSIAIVGISETPPTSGEWQYALCGDMASDSFSACLNLTSPWITIMEVSESSALVLPNTAQVRFVRKAVELEGAVWLRVKLWDGNTVGFLSPRNDLVRTAQPHFNSTLPYTSNGAYSENTTLLTILVHPLIEPPKFNSLASFQFSSVDEDLAFVQNRGSTIADVIVQVDIPNFMVIPDDRIEGFPSYELYEELLPNESRQAYYSQVQRVNPTRKERQQAMVSGQYPGVGIGFDSSDISQGRWQVSHNGDPRRFVFLDSVITDDNIVVLLNTSARMRFVPHSDFCGMATILVRPWDGFWNDTVATLLENGYIVTSEPSENDTTLSLYNLNSWEMGYTNIECIRDNPVTLQDRVQLDPIPYRISYRYERLFTALVDREIGSFRSEQERYTDFLQLILLYQVDIKRLSPAKESRTYVSFSVDGDLLSFNEVNELVMERKDTLADLDFDTLSLSLDASYGAGPSCQSDDPQHYHGTQVNTFVSTFTSDGDPDYLGMAVVGVSTNPDHGVWQYYRGDWNNTDIASDFNPNSSVWVNFPSFISKTGAFLLHGNDRFRFLPRPDLYWSNTNNDPNLPPSIQVKVWDSSIGFHDLVSAAEVLRMNINTNPFVDTFQSLTHPTGLFSDSTVTVEATRYGCDGIINSGLTDDACCVCGGNGLSCTGCNGQMGSNIVYDACNVCDGDDTSCLGCDFIPFSSTERGTCAECISDVSIPTGDNQVELLYPSSSFEDCSGVCYGAALTDECGVCSGGETAHVYNSDMDCSSVCFGNATTDNCGDCTGPGTGLAFNQNIDCTGICGGPFVADSCGICQHPDEDGSVVEHRDCAGVCFGEARLDGCSVCYGGTTGLAANMALDECGVCDGDNTTCIGCDGVVNSGKVVDSCGICGGNDCSCFEASSLQPMRGPRTGGTEVIVRGAGFFLNDSSLNFTFDPDAENCGAPFRYPSTGATIPVTCLFGGNDEQQLQSVANAIDQSTISCVTEPTIAFQTYIPEFSVQVRIADGPFSNPIPFYYDDYSAIEVTAIVPDNAGLNQATIVSFIGHDFLNIPDAVCFVYGIADCNPTFATVNPFTMPATYHSSSVVLCELPKAEIPCRVTVRLSLDGQESGIVESPTSDLQFIYLYSTPKVIIHFTDDLSSLVIQFDRQVELSNNILLKCENIFTNDTLSLLGGLAATCYWSNNKQQEIIVSLPADAMVHVASPITFTDGVLQTRDQLYSYTINNLTVFVDSEVNAVQPVAVLNGPRTIPSCGTATFTAVYSLYTGYSGGFKYEWSVVVLDSSTEGYGAIFRYLESLTPDSATITLESNWFIANTNYYLEMYVINSIGVQSKSEILLLLKDSVPLPQVSIVGSSEREIYPGEDLLVQSQVAILDCAPPVSQLDFAWQLFRIMDPRQLSLAEEDLSTIHTQSPDIFIPAAYFIQDTSYILQLTVTADGQDEVTVDVTVTVSLSPIQARIHGGKRTVSLNRTLVLDARESSMNPNLPEAGYIWSCNVIGSFEPCYNQSESISTPVVIPSMDFITIPANDLEPAKTYNFTLSFSQGSEISHTTTEIEISPSEPPIVEILTPISNLLSSQTISLEGLVYSTLPTETVHWESLVLPGQAYVDLSNPDIVQSQTTYLSPQDLSSSSIDDYTSIPLDVSVSEREISRANLVLRPNVLSIGLTYTFRLTAVSVQGSGFAQVSITPDPPPHSASISIEPEAGVALETEFTVTVSGGVDSTTDTPLLFQFGVLQDFVSEGSILWISGIQISNFLNTLLPTGEQSNNFTHSIMARIFDRKGGYSDVVTQVLVNPNNLATKDFYDDILGDIGSSFTANKDWSTTLSTLSAVLLDVNKDTEVQSQNLKQESLDIFLEIFNNHLPQTEMHYALGISLLKEITSNGGIASAAKQQEIAQALEEIVEWFRRESALQSFQAEVSTQNGEEPLLLLSNYRGASGRKRLFSTLAKDLIASWVNMLETQEVIMVAKSFVENVESIGHTLCQERVLGEDAVSIAAAPLAELYLKTAKPTGAFNISNILVDFRESLSDLFTSQACAEENLPCSESCIQVSLYPIDFFPARDMQILKLSTSAQEMLRTEIEGSDPESIELFSDIVSVSVSIPSQNGFLDITDLSSTIQVYIPLREPVSNSESQPLCLSRAVGGTNGFENFEWQLDTLNTPQRATISSMEYFVCEFNHLSEFAVGLLPPPIIIEPPLTTSIPTSTRQLITSSQVIEQSSEVPTETPTTDPPVVVDAAGGAASPAVVAVPIVLVLVILIAVGVVLAVVFVWRQKKRKKMRIMPGETADKPQVIEAFTEEDRAREKAQLLKAGLLTPEESKIPMQIIQLQENGERSLVGSMNVLPSVRLRELRNELGEQFHAFKKKPFYFLTRQLGDIEPAAEQQQFVSLVFGDTPDRPIFVREVAVMNEQTRRHFCVCGSAAQFECSNCSSQGYCSQECQIKHWNEQHQRECNRLSEKRRRSEVLLRRQSSGISTLSPISERPRRITIATSPSEAQSELTAPTPTDWKSFLSSSKAFQPPPLLRERTTSTTEPPSVHVLPEKRTSLPTPPPISPRTSLGQLAAQPSVPGSQETTDLSQRPITKLLSTGARRQLPPLSRATSVPAAASSTLSSLSQQRTFLSPQPAMASSLYGTSSPQSLDQSFERQSWDRPQPDPAAFFTVRKGPSGVTRVPFSPRSQLLSVQSVGPEDLTTSLGTTMYRDLRNEPLLESDEEDYESSTESESQTRTTVTPRGARVQSGSRPPSLAVRKKRVSEDSGSSSESESSSSSDEDQAGKPLLTQKGGTPSNSGIKPPSHPNTSGSPEPKDDSREQQTLSATATITSVEVTAQEGT